MRILRYKTCVSSFCSVVTTWADRSQLRIMMLAQATAQTTLNVLLVEDDEVDVLKVKRAFKKRNIPNPLYFASNGLEALSLLRHLQRQSPSQPCLVFLDLNMPRMNGLEFLRIRSQDPQLRSVPVIIMTTSDNQSERQEAHRLDVAGYLLKGMNFQHFVDTLDTILTHWTPSPSSE